MVRALLLTVGLFLVCSTLHAQSVEVGEWVSLFNGKDTKGWVQAKSGQNSMPWKVEDGALTNGVDHGGMDLATEAEFDNYELEIDYKVKKGGNSGVYLRGQVEVQIHDSPTEGKLSPGHVGGIYGVAGPTSNPQKSAGEWNQFRIRHLGKRVMVWHNGVLVQDDVYVPGKTGGAMGSSVNPDRKGEPLGLDRGPIMLQGDHGYVWFRNIRIRKYCSADDGWRQVWNDQDLSQLTANGPKIEDWWEVCEAPRSFTNKTWYRGPEDDDRGRDAWTKEKFGNFVVHYEYKSNPKAEGGNSGFYLRDQWEIQIHGDQSTTNKHGDGALYSWHAPTAAASHGPGKWNVMTAKVDGMKIWVWQNGTLIHDEVELLKRTDNHSADATPASQKRPFKFQGDHGQVWFKNLWIQEAE
jgi:hypothetical protein